jgi:hypothetical protein
MHMAAGVLGDAARKLGLDPATIGSSPHAAVDAQEADEGPELNPPGPLASPASGPLASPSSGPFASPSSGPFDFERGEEPAWAAVSASATPPAPAGAARPNAPFDGEREGAIRAA